VKKLKQVEEDGGEEGRSYEGDLRKCHVVFLFVDNG